MSSSDRKVSLWHPTLWPTQAGVWFFRVLCRNLPWHSQMAIGRAAGRFAYHVLRIRRHVVEVNLKLCFPDKSEQERKQLAAAHYEAIGMGLFETVNAWWTPKDRLPPCEIVGKEHLIAASAAGKGVLLLTAHFTTLEICGRYFCDAFTMGGLYRDPENPVIAHEMHLSRAKRLDAAIPMNDLRGFIRALRLGKNIWYAPDQGLRGKFSTILPFFGVPAQTNTATSRIAEMSGSAVLPFFGTRKPDGTYLLTILPPFENFPTNDPKEDTLRFTHVMEEQILRTPEQYFWIHRRFKRRGKGYPSAYKPQKKKSK